MAKIAGLFVFALLAVLPMAQANLKSTLEFMIPMRDGVKLHTFVDFPLFEKKDNYTMVMDRSPYGAYGTELIADIFILFGFVAVRQDMRGTHQSEGNFTLWHNASTDARDTMDFLTKQSWSDGTVFTVGASADGIASFAEVLSDPPMLHAQTIIFATSKGREDIFPGGAYRMALIERWLRGTVPKQADHLIAMTRANEAPGPWWNPINDTGKYHLVHFPSVMWAGWYDIFLNGNLKGFYGYRYGADAKYRNQATLVVDPLGHCQHGSKYFPKNTIEGRTLLPLFLAIDLYKGKTEPRAEGVKALTFYVMGATSSDAPGNYWTTLDEWPTFKPTSLFLNGDNTLSFSAPNSAAPSTSYSYDPNNPVPTIGGNNLEIHCGPLDQTPVENRSDVIVFTSAPLNSSLAVTGELFVELYVSGITNDTDFTAKLTDVYPNGGPSQLIQDGIRRMRWRDTASARPVPMEPGTVYKIQISLWNTSYVFPAGHRIRVAISSSNYPRFDANPNNGLPLTMNGTAVVAKNTIYHSKDHPSRLILPQIQLSQVPEIHILDLPSYKEKMRVLERGLGQDRMQDLLQGKWLPTARV